MSSKLDMLGEGDSVLVCWMDNLEEATIYKVEAYHRGARLKEPRYRLSIAGVRGHPWYDHHEIIIIPTPRPPAAHLTPSSNPHHTPTSNEPGS